MVFMKLETLIQGDIFFLWGAKVAYYY